MVRFAVIATLVIVGVIVLETLVCWLITLFWGWVVPDIFSGAVAHGTLPAALTLFQAFKLSVLLWILGLTSHASSSKSS